MTELNNDYEEERREDQKALVKEAFKEGLKEWLSDQFAAFGWWSLKGIAAVGFSVLVYLWLASHGWKTPQIAP